MEAAPAKPQGRLLVSTQLDAKDELEEVCKGQQQHEEVCLGLFTLVLTEPTQAQRCYRDLTLVNRDGMNVILVKINQILMEKDWVLKSAMLIAMSVYTFLRLIVDHGAPNLLTLRQKEVDFCISMLREKFMECLLIGRDLVRLLQNVARIPEMELVWKDLLHNPQVLSPQFTGVLQLLTARTSRKFLACRLTPDMETKLLFMTSRVRFGQQKRYQDWFQRQYLSTAESQSLRCDLIRYICGVVHPSNEVLSSDILPRWAIIGWLLTTCTIIPHFFPPLESQVRQGVFNSLTFIMEKRVLA
ncbi:Integrator complex subunit 3 [Larimichthys crocea]|nr:Integrator complex subunit 3 [Larimichthys crocea]